MDAGLQSSLHHAPCLEVGDIRTGCLRRRLEFGHDRDHRGWALRVLHLLSSIKQQVRVTNFPLSLRPRESVVSIATKASDNFSSIDNRVGSFHDKRGRKTRDLCCPHHHRWLPSNSRHAETHATSSGTLPLPTALIWT